jgi:hypothetical protein
MQQSAFGSRKSPTTPRDPGVTMPKGRRLWSQVATTPFAVRHHLFHQPGRLRHGSGGFLATSQPPGVLVSVTLNTPIASDGQQTVSFAGRWGSRKGPASTRIDATLDRGCLHSLRRKSLCIDRLKDIHSRDLVDVKNPRGRLGLLHLWKRRGFARRRGKASYTPETLTGAELSCVTRLRSAIWPGRRVTERGSCPRPVVRRGRVGLSIYIYSSVLRRRISKRFHLGFPGELMAFALAIVHGVDLGRCICIYSLRRTRGMGCEDRRDQIWLGSTCSRLESCSRSSSIAASLFLPNHTSTRLPARCTGSFL